MSLLGKNRQKMKCKCPRKSQNKCFIEFFSNVDIEYNIDFQKDKPAVIELAAGF